MRVQKTNTISIGDTISVVDKKGKSQTITIEDGDSVFDAANTSGKDTQPLGQVGNNKPVLIKDVQTGRYLRFFHKNKYYSVSIDAIPGRTAQAPAAPAGQPAAGTPKKTTHTGWARIFPGPRKAPTWSELSRSTQNHWTTEKNAKGGFIGFFVDNIIKPFPKDKPGWYWTTRILSTSLAVILLIAGIAHPPIFIGYLLWAMVAGWAPIYDGSRALLTTGGVSQFNVQDPYGQKAYRVNEAIKARFGPILEAADIIVNKVADEANITLIINAPESDLTKADAINVIQRGLQGADAKQLLAREVKDAAIAIIRLKKIRADWLKANLVVALGTAKISRDAVIALLSAHLDSRPAAEKLDMSK